MPADIRRDGGVARMSDPAMIKSIMEAVSIPVMAKVRIGHFVEAQILEAVGVDYIDESEVLTPADDENHINKHSFGVPFVCGSRNLGEALRRISEGAAMIRTKVPTARVVCRVSCVGRADGSVSIPLLWQELQAAKIDMKQRFGLPCSSLEVQQMKYFIYFY